jgi:hypothetical protein
MPKNKKISAVRKMRAVRKSMALIGVEGELDGRWEQ